MDKNTAELIVKIYAILGWIGAAFSIIGGLAMIFGGSILGGLGMFGNNPMLSGFFAGFAVIAGIITLALGVFFIYASLGLWRHKEWARIVLVVFSVLGILSILSLNIVGAVIGGLGLWLFQFEPTVKGLFK